MTEVYLSAYHALIKSGYEDPVPHVHQAAHIIIALEQEITCTVGEENYCCRGIVIPSNVKHTIVSEGMPVIIFLFEETTITAEQIKETRVIEPEIAVKMAELYEKLLAKAVDKNAGCKIWMRELWRQLLLCMSMQTRTLQLKKLLKCSICRKAVFPTCLRKIPVFLLRDF